MYGYYNGIICALHFEYLIRKWNVVMPCKVSQNSIQMITNHYMPN
jgi:hypothetical protein